MAAQCPIEQKEGTSGRSGEVKKTSLFSGGIIAFSFSDVNKKGLFTKEQKILETFFPITHYQKALDFWTHFK